MKYSIILAASILLSIFCFTLSAGEAQMSFPIAFKQLPIDIMGMSVISHTYSKEIRYSQSVSEELGSLVRLFITQRTPSPMPLELQFTFNEKTPSELLASGDWTWYEMSENLSAQGKPYFLSLGKIYVFTFNAKKANWGIGAKFNFAITAINTKIGESFDIPINLTNAQINLISCFASDNDPIYPDMMLVHLENNSEISYKIKRFRLFASTPTGMKELTTIDKFDTFTKDGVLPSKDRSGARFFTGKLPLTHGVLEVVLEDLWGKENSLWAYLKFKKDQFDIGSGWLDIPSRPGIPPVTKESYLKLLKRMHVNLAHIENIPGYTDSIGKDGLYARYPLRMMSGFGDIDRYNNDEWVAKIHGVDALGEPQMGQKPEETYEALRKYKRAKYPTTLTLSQDSGFRYYAGLSDFPHFDAYRVTAPAADTWSLYDRWEDGLVLWGAPLEGIGEMTRTLRSLSRPLPIALWSQNVNGGWEGGLGRKRRSPTSDEILMQAYQGLANGVMGLYWYSLQGWSVLKYRDTLNMTTKIGREIRLLEDFYLAGDAYKHERINLNGKPDLDLNSIVTPNSTLLFILDLDYEPDRKAQVFRFKGERPVEASFQLPGYLGEIKDLFKINADGIYDVDWKLASKSVTLNDRLDRVGIYVATTDPKMREKLYKRLNDLVAMEKSIGFDPANNDVDFAVLMHDLGFEQLEDVGPELKPKRPISEGNTMANPVYLALESSVQKEIGLTEDQIDSIYEISEKYQIELYTKMRNESSESNANLTPEQRRENYGRQRERRLKIAEGLLPTYLGQLKAILQPKQLERLNQITLQAMGISALKNTEIMSALKITKEQQDRFSAIEQNYNQRRSSLYDNRLSGDERRQKTAEINKEQNKEIMNVLSEEQKTKLNEIKGVIFEM